MTRIMTKQVKIQILPGAFTYDAVDLFKSHGWQVVQHSPDVVAWLGGCDIDPHLYQENRLPETYCSPHIDHREMAVFKDFPNDFPKIGICRGGQLLNVLSGGKMWQDTDHHHQPHASVDKDTGKIVTLSSIHHQMMRPSDKAKVLTTARISSYVKSANGIVKRAEEEYDDIEAVYYPETNSLCYQPHPEVDGKAGREYFFSLVEKTLGL